MVVVVVVCQLNALRCPLMGGVASRAGDRQVLALLLACFDGANVLQLRTFLAPCCVYS